MMKSQVVMAIGFAHKARKPVYYARDRGIMYLLEAVEVGHVNGVKLPLHVKDLAQLPQVVVIGSAKQMVMVLNGFVL
jgi:hypothetical protein